MMRMPYSGGFSITKLYGTDPPAGMHYSAGKHPGIDLVGRDKEIYAVKSGSVHLVSYDEKGWGKYVVVKQDDNLYAIYCHLAKAKVHAGQSIKEGEYIGDEGSTGQVTGQHLHLEFRKKYSDKFSTINPTEYLGLKNKTGRVEVEDMEEIIEIDVDGEIRKVKATVVNGNYKVFLRDLESKHIHVGYENKRPTVRTK